MIGSTYFLQFWFGIRSYLWRIFGLWGSSFVETLLWWTTFYFMEDMVSSNENKGNVVVMVLYLVLDNCFRLTPFTFWKLEFAPIIWHLFGLGIWYVTSLVTTLVHWFFSRVLFVGTMIILLDCLLLCDCYSFDNFYFLVYLFESSSLFVDLFLDSVCFFVLVFG